MPESGGSSQKSRSSGLGLFKRRRQPSRSRNMAQQDLLSVSGRDSRHQLSRNSVLPLSLPLDSRMGQANSARRSGGALKGDVCQIGTGVPTKDSSKRFNVWGWLSGKRSRRWKDRAQQRRQKSSDTQLDLNQAGDRRGVSQSQIGQTSLSKNRKQVLNSGQILPHSRLDDWQSSSAGVSKTGRRLQPLNGHSQSASLQPPPRKSSDYSDYRGGYRSRLSDSPSVIPLAQRRNPAESRSPGALPPRRSNTRLQSNQPTLVQASTSLQQSTLLQGRKTLLKDERRSPKVFRQEEVPSRPQSRSLAIALYAARMVILSVGVGVLAGTVLSAWNPANNPFFGDQSNQSIKQASSAGKSSPPQTSAAGQLVLAQELAPLKTAVQGVAQQYPGFTPGVFLIDLDNNNFVDWGGSASFAAASTIKVPVLIAFFQDVDAGKIRLDEKLTMRKDLIATESGDMQYLPPGAQFTALETATKMITISDNTATNMLIDRLGGIQAVNQRFKSWGLSATQITSLLPDLKGTNTTSPKELASLMMRVSQGELVSLRSRDRLLDIMRRTVNNSQLPQGLGEGATIAHKTGDIGTLIGDVGLVDMPSGKRYATAVLIKRGFNDDRAYDLVQKISRAMYQHFVNTATLQKRPADSAPVQTTPITPNLEPEEANTDAQNIPSEAPNSPDLMPEQPNSLQAATP